MNETYFEESKKQPIAKAYNAFYGTILLNLNSEIADELNKVFETGEQLGEAFYEPYYHKVFLLQMRFEEILKRNEFISNIRWMGEVTETHNEPFLDYRENNNEYLMQFPTPIIFDVTLPLESRKYFFEVKGVTDLAQKFSVIYDGYIFLAYVPIFNSDSETAMIGPEIREFLSDLFKCDKWSTEVITPCPIRTSFYVQSQNEKLKDELQLTLLDENIDEETYSEDYDINECMEFLFINNSSSIQWFSELQTYMDKVNAIADKINNVYDSIKSEFRFSKFKRIKKYKKIRRQILKLYSLLYEYDKSVYEYKKNEKSFLSSIAYDVFVSMYIEDYLKKDIGVDIFPQINMIKAVESIEEELNLYKINLYVIIGAIIGAVSGIMGVIIATIIQG